MPWWSLRVGRRGWISKRGFSVGVGRARVGQSWPKIGIPPGAARTNYELDHFVDIPQVEEHQSDRERAEYQEWLATQPENVKQAALDVQIARAREQLGVEASLSQSRSEPANTEEDSVDFSGYREELVRELAALTDASSAEHRKDLTEMLAEHDRMEAEWKRWEAEHAAAQRETDDTFAEIDRLAEEYDELALADEIATMKARDPQEWARLLASLPAADRENMRRIEKKHGA